MVKMPATDPQLIPVGDATEAIRAEYAERLTVSDIDCLVSIYEQGHLCVERDKKTRALVISPDPTKPEVERFLDEIFDLRL